MHPPSASDERTNRWPMALGAIVVVLVIGAFWVFRSQPAGNGVRGAAHPYAAQLKLTEIKMATAQNFVGATVTYLEGEITNAGEKTVTHAVAEITFKNSLDQIAQQDKLPIMVLEERPGYSDAVDLSSLPLAPGQTRPFRLTFEHVSADWNQAYPEVRITEVTLKP
jgi:hypothetical protein